MIIINSLEEIKSYYVKEINTYIFNDDVKFTFNLNIKRNIKAYNIKAYNIDAGNIDAGDISYYAVCYANESIKCKSIKGRRENSKHFCLDSEIEFKE